MKKIFVFCIAITFLMITKFSNAQTQVTFYTSMGTFVAEMYDTLQPITTGNFIGLVNAKFYDGIIFHRVIAGFMIQGGDPTGTGYGGSGVTIPDEFDPNTSNVQKAIAMANSGPNTGTSQFFINLVNNTYLDSGYPVFGIVITNFSVVQAIGNVPTDGNDKPLTDVVMDSVRVTLPFNTGINEQDNQFSEISIFPNPVTEESIILINSKYEETVNISIYNQLGKVIYCEQKKLLSGVNNISSKEIHEADLSQGLYYLVVKGSRSISKQKLIIL